MLWDLGKMFDRVSRCSSQSDKEFYLKVVDNWMASGSFALHPSPPCSLARDLEDILIAH